MGVHRTPAASKRRRASESLKRAAPYTSLWPANEHATGSATRTVTPVTTILAPRSGAASMGVLPCDSSSLTNPTDRDYGAVPGPAPITTCRLKPSPFVPGCYVLRRHVSRGTRLGHSPGLQESRG